MEIMLLKMGFPTSFVSLIMKCTISFSYEILINGQPSRHLFPKRGLRQRDPLSPTSSFYVPIRCQV